jgi:hypothetical protein
MVARKQGGENLFLLQELVEAGIFYLKILLKVE